MKKRLVFSLLIILAFMLTGCDLTFSENGTDGDCTKIITNNKDAQTIVLPDVSGKTLVEAIVSVNGDLNFNPIYVKSNEFLPGKIISYGAGLKAGDVVEVGMTIDLKVAEKPENSVSHDDRIEFVSEISRLTGPNSIENGSDLLDAGIYGTDLGIPVQIDDRIMFLFGDSFSSSGMKGMWTSNFMALTTDTNYNDGLNLDLITNKDNGMTISFAQGKHQNGNETDTSVEVTKIPTGGIQVGDYVYVFFMSIRYWGIAGEWNVNYNQVVRSNKTDLKNWELVNGLKWSEEEAPNFGQIYPFRDSKTGYIYIYGIPGGRNGGCVIGRVKEENFLNKNEYEYQTAEGIWTKGQTGLSIIKQSPYYIVSPQVSELSVSYNEYLNKYIMSFYKNGKLIFVQSDKPDGAFTDSIYLLDQTDYNGIYGGFILPSLTNDGGKSIYMTVSCWKDYNVYWVKVVLK